MGDPYNLTNENFLPMININPSNQKVLDTIDVFDNEENSEKGHT